MRKKCILILVIALAMVFAFAGCNKDSQKSKVSGGPALSDPVTSNGGLIVRKGDYYYFINGMASSKDDVNKMGETVKGGVMRAKVSEISDASKHELVLDRLVFSANTAEGGFSVFGDHIYYTTPYDEKDKSGNLQTDYLNFRRVKLDGSGSESIAVTNTKTLSLPYKYYEKDGKVLLAYVEDSKIYTVDCDSKAVTTAVDTYTGTPVFSTVPGDAAVYYTQSVYWDVTAADKNNEVEKDDNNKNIQARAFNKVIRQDLFSGEKKEIFNNRSADGTKINENTYTITPSKVESDYLYYTAAETAGGSSLKGLYRTPAGTASGFGIDLNKDILIQSDTAQTGYLTAPNGNGILFQGTDSLVWRALTKDGGKQVRFAMETGTTLFQIIAEEGVNFLYYFDSSAALKKIELPDYADVKSDEPLNWSDYESVAVMTVSNRKDELSQDKMDTSWIKPEYLDGKWFFFNSGDNAYDRNDSVETEEEAYYAPATMYIRKNYLFMYDTSKAGTAAIRLGALTAADKTTETDGLKEENENREEAWEKQQEENEKNA